MYTLHHYCYISCTEATLQREIKVSFVCGDVGQYEMPIMFSFRKAASKEGIVIIRDMVRYLKYLNRIIANHVVLRDAKSQQNCLSRSCSCQVSKLNSMDTVIRRIKVNKQCSIWSTLKTK